MVTSSQRKKLSGVSIYCHPWKTRRLYLVNNNRSIIMPVCTVCTARTRAQIAGYITLGACSGIDLSDMRLVEASRLSVFHTDTVYLSLSEHPTDIIVQVSTKIIRERHSMEKKKCKNIYIRTYVIRYMYYMYNI